MHNKIYNSITELIGNTPMLRLNKYSERMGVNAITAKLEMFNPLSSVKDRVALSMITDAEERGLLKADSVIIEPTSGNTGIGLAYVAVTRGYKCVLVMPESMSMERRMLMKGLGAELVLTPAAEGMRGAIAKANELLTQTPNSYMPMQFDNPANVQAHKSTTAPEIFAATGGDITHFVAGVGTGGTITGVGEYLKEKLPHVKIVAVEPAASAVISGNPPGKHGIQGIGAGFIPSILNKNIIDEIITVDEDSSHAARKLLAETEGVFCGISGGAALHAATLLAKSHSGVVTLLPDTGERYLSMNN